MVYLGLALALAAIGAGLPSAWGQNGQIAPQRPAVEAVQPGAGVNLARAIAIETAARDLSGRLPRPFPALVDSTAEAGRRALDALLAMVAETRPTADSIDAPVLRTLDETAQTFATAFDRFIADLAERRQLFDDSLPIVLTQLRLRLQTIMGGGGLEVGSLAGDALTAVLLAYTHATRFHDQGEPAQADRALAELDVAADILREINRYGLNPRIETAVTEVVGMVARFRDTFLRIRDRATTAADLHDTRLLPLAARLTAQGAALRRAAVARSEAATRATTTESAATPTGAVSAETMAENQAPDQIDDPGPPPQAAPLDLTPSDPIQADPTRAETIDGNLGGASREPTGSPPPASAQSTESLPATPDPGGPDFPMLFALGLGGTGAIMLGIGLVMLVRRRRSDPVMASGRPVGATNTELLPQETAVPEPSDDGVPVVDVGPAMAPTVADQTDQTHTDQSKPHHLTDQRTSDEATARAAAENQVAVLEESHQRMRNALADMEALAREAEAANRSKTQFLINMGALLGRPVNMMIRQSQTVMDGLHRAGAGHLTTDVESIQWSGEQVMTLIGALNDLARIEAGTLSVNPEDFDVGHMVVEVRERMLPVADLNSNRLLVTSQPDIGSAWSDFTKMRQILLNLLDNACRYTHRGRIDLNAERLDSGDRPMVRFTVSDSGCGIAPEQAEHLFEPFVTAAPHDGVNGQYPGAGLGLAIVYHFTAILGGTVTIAGRPGVGTRVTVLLPAVHRTADAEDGHRRRVLHVGHSLEGPRWTVEPPPQAEADGMTTMEADGPAQP